MPDSTTITGRASGWRLPIIGTGAVLAVLLLVIAFGPSSEMVQASSTTWTTTLTSNQDGDRYGYDRLDRYGSLSDGTFEYDGETYTVDLLRWDQSDEKIALGLDKCLKPSDFESLTIGSTKIL